GERNGPTGPSLGSTGPTERAGRLLAKRRLAEKRLDLGEEVRHRLDAVLRPELERSRPLGRLEGEHDRSFSTVLPDNAGELADEARGRAARVDAQANLTPLRRRLERPHLSREQLRLAFLLVVDPSRHDEDAVDLAELARLGVDRLEDDHL